VTTQLGYQTTDLLKKPLSDFCIVQDQQTVKEQFKAIFETKQTQPVQMTLHMIPNSSSSSAFANENQPPQEAAAIPFKSSAYAFLNPCNDTFEFIVCTHVNQNRLNDISSTAPNMSSSASLYPSRISSVPPLHPASVNSQIGVINQQQPMQQHLHHQTHHQSSQHQHTHNSHHQFSQHLPQQQQHMHHQMDTMQQQQYAPYQHLNTYNIVQPVSSAAVVANNPYHMPSSSQVDDVATNMAGGMVDPSTSSAAAGVGTAPFVYPSTIGNYLGKY
jgi:hypothetical protein